MCVCARVCERSALPGARISVCSMGWSLSEHPLLPSPQAGRLGGVLPVLPTPALTFLRPVWATLSCTGPCCWAGSRLCALLRH